MADHKKKKDKANQAQPPPEGNRFEKIEPLNTEHQRMLTWLKTLKFRKTLFGGVNEADVWKKLEELNRLYEASLIAERARYDALLEVQSMPARDRSDEDRPFGADTTREQQFDPESRFDAGQQARRMQNPADNDAEGCKGV